MSRNYPVWSKKSIAQDTACGWCVRRQQRRESRPISRSGACQQSSVANMMQAEDVDAAPHLVSGPDRL